MFATACNDEVSGSTTACRALLAQMAAKRVAMLASWLPKKGGQPRMLALSPQLEARDAHGAVDLPHGFHVTSLPYAGDFRQVPLAPCAAEPPAEAVDAARELIGALSAEYAPRPNPLLAHFYARLEAAALNEPAPTTADETLPDEAAMLKRARGQVERFKAAAYGEEYDPEAGVKKARPPKAALPATAEEWRALAATAGGLDGLTCDVLRGYCTARKLKKGGSKKELVERVAEHIADDAGEE